MGKIESHRDLLVWQKAMDMTEMVYNLTVHFPKSETFKIVAQVTHSAASVPANIAEGNARGTKRDYSYFLSIAKGSLMETETYLLLAIRLKYITKEEAQPVLDLIIEISKMLTALRARLAE